MTRIFKFTSSMIFCCILPAAIAFAEAKELHETHKTQVVIVGGIHSFHHKNPKYSPEILKEIILSLKPDAILNELPLSLVDPNGRPIIRSRDANEPETWAADQVAQELGIKQIPFDRPDRQENFKKTKHFERRKRAEELFSKWLEQLKKNNPESVDLKIAQLSTYGDQAEIYLFKNCGPKAINSEGFDAIIRIRHDLWKKIRPEILKRYPGYETLVDDYHFERNQWQERNEIMADNIIKAAREYPGKRLVVITGAEHRYILRDLLKNEPCIDLKEYWQIAKSSLEQPHNSNESNQPDYAKLIEPDKLKEDLDFLFKTIEEVHQNMYAYTTKEEFEPIRERLYEEVAKPMNRVEFYKLAAPALASLKSFHTIMLPFTEQYEEYSKNGGKVFPLELQWDGANAILMKNYSSTVLPLGGGILEINGRDASELFTSFSRWFAAENRNTNPWLIDLPVSLRALLLLEYGPVATWELKIQTTNGAVERYDVAALALSEFKTDEAMATIERKKHYRYIPEYNTGLIEFYKWREPEKLKIFFDKTFREISEKKVSNLIIDIRENPGGSDTCFHSLIEYLTAKPYRLYEKAEIKISPQTRERIEHIWRQAPDIFANKKDGDTVTLELPLRTPADNPFRFSGRTFLLVGRHSFSASTVFAAIIKCFKIATLIGEETGDPTTLYADSIVFKLPNSRLRVWVASKLLVAAGGKPDGRGVLPDYEVKQKPEDTANGVDTVMQFTLNLIKDPDFGIEQKADNQIQIERTEK